ncbi:MAG TPA: multiheme c-type cytochrome [Longimicrobiales bacterium]|nr:multiheme c-type cytochrome [Longimicrobiales bacterium]
MARSWQSPNRWLGWASLLFVLLASSGCEEDVIYRDRVLFDDPPAAAGDFLGFSDVDANETVCGNCHVGKQAEWILTAHADAWETLEESGESRAFCEGCHTVNERGNATEGSVGWDATKDERYQDVQCESCHGPGLQHVQNPDASQPLASIRADTLATNGCGECHSGAHHPFVEEWSESGHARLNATPAGREACQSCHTAQGALRAFGERSEYIEKDSAQLPLTCAVCHDPHGGANTAEGQHAGQLRFPVRNAPSIDEHLCAQCHNRRDAPVSTSHGLEPHAPQAGLLEGTAGWWAPGSVFNPIRGTHGSDRNPGLCATCHVVSFSAEDQLTGGEIFTTGHMFNAIPCTDASGAPTTDDCAYTVSARSWQGCTASGCHGDATAARSALISQASSVLELADSLHTLLLIVDPTGEAPGGEIDDTNPTFTVAEGAIFNFHLAKFNGEGVDPLHSVAATTVHNPFLIETLLRASINAVQESYGLAPPAPAPTGTAQQTRR